MEQTTLEENGMSQKAADLAAIMGSDALKNVYAEIEDKKANILSTAFNKEGETEEQNNEPEEKEEPKKESVLEAIAKTEFNEEEELGEIPSETEEEKENEDKPRKGENRNFKPWQISKENHRLHQHNQQLTAELQRTRQDLEKVAASESKIWNDYVISYESNATNDLSYAKAALKFAKENYDTDAEIKALELFNEANSRVINAKRYRDDQKRLDSEEAARQQYMQQQQYYAQNQYQQPAQQVQYPTQQYPQYQPQPQGPSEAEIKAAHLIEDWVFSHDVINPKSRAHDKAVEDQLKEKARQYEEMLVEQNRGHEILSDGYFNAMDRILDNIVKKRSAPSRAPAPSTAHIGSARSSGGGSGSSSKSKTITLTAAEEDAIDTAAGVAGHNGAAKEAFREQWIQNIIKYQQQRK